MGQSPVSPFAKGEIIIKIKRRRGEKPLRGFSVGNPRRGFPITRRRVRPAAKQDVCLGENINPAAR